MNIGYSPIYNLIYIVLFIYNLFIDSENDGRLYASS